MLPCELCQPQLMSYLYDLLETEERRDVAAHLESCPACQDAMSLARQQKDLFAEAVKEVHADIVFKAPVKASAASTQPTVAFTPVRPRRFLKRWAAAAAILLALLSGGAAAGWAVWHHQLEQIAATQARLARANKDLQNSQHDLTTQKVDTQKEIIAIQQQIDTLFESWKNEETKTREVLKDQETMLRIDGPKFKAGTTNSYIGELLPPMATNLFTQNPKNDTKEKKDAPKAQNFRQVQVRVVDQTNNTVIDEQQVDLNAKDKFNFDLRPDLPVKPGSNLAIEFLTQTDDGKAVMLRDKLQVMLTEYVTHLTTDRPLYRPGDTVRFRSLTLERFSLKPAQESFHLLYRIRGPKDAEIFKQEVSSSLVTDGDRKPILGPDGAPVRGLGAGEFTLPADLPNGKYTLTVSEVNERFHEEKRTFLVNRWQAPRFRKEAQFDRQSYGAGDPIKVNVRAVGLQGMAANVKGGLAVRARFEVDGKEISDETKQTDDDGQATFETVLPVNIDKGVGTLTVACGPPETSETLVREIPIAVRDLEVEFFPEGGDLIAGVPNRVYFQVRTPAGKPADLEGRLLDDNQQEITRVQTLTDDQEPGINQGMGSFTFTPRANRIYKLKIDSPIGIERVCILPAVKKQGVVLNVREPVVDREIPLTLHSMAKGPHDLLVGAYCRGRLLAHAFLTVQPGVPAQLTLAPLAEVGGVYRITVFEKRTGAGHVTYRPLAERLVYRKNPARVEVVAECENKYLQPGDRVKVSLWSRNEKREPAPSLAMVAVVDANVLKLADDKTARGMPTHFLLTNEIRNPDDLENADVLLGAHPKAAPALDLLLGCQGWRRFAEQDPQAFEQELNRKQTKMPAFLANSTVTQVLDAEQKKLDQLDQDFASRAVELEKHLAAKESLADGPPPLQRNVVKMRHGLEATYNELQQEELHLREIRAYLIQFGLGVGLLTLLGLGLVLIRIGLGRLSEGRSPRVWFASGVGLLLLLFAVSLVGTFAMMGEPFFDFPNRFDRRGAGWPRGGKIEEEKPDRQPAPSKDFVLNEDTDEEPERMAAKIKVAGKMKPAPRPQPAEIAEIGKHLEELAVRDIIADDAPPNERTLRKRGEFQALLQKHLRRRVILPPANDPSIVRVYAHQRPVQKAEFHYDLTETIYWHPALVLQGGMAHLEFDLADSLTHYRILVVSHTLDGRIGTNQIVIASRLPFSVEPQVPVQVTQGDQIKVSVAINNKLDKKTSATLSERGGQGVVTLGNPNRGVQLEAKKGTRELFDVQAEKEGPATVRFVTSTVRNSEAVERRLEVVPDGYPVTGSISGMLDNNVDQVLTLPADFIKGSLQVQAHFYPSPLAELQNGLEALLREPSGSFEQSSAGNYSNVMVLTYLNKTNQTNPTLEKRARQQLQSLYPKLTTFECLDPNKKGNKAGYGLFENSASPHEALTANGLWQFTDMAKVYKVDPAMLQRNEKYLLDQRDNTGGFQRNAKTPDRLGRAPDHLTNAYVVWSLAESGTRENLDVELASLNEQCKARQDPYFYALVALSDLKNKKTREGIELLKKVGAFQKKDGMVDGAATSITGSQGRDLQVETTALAILSWLEADRPEFKRNLDDAYRWLGTQRRGAGNFGATQATVLALKAMVAYADKYPRSLNFGEVQMTIRHTLPQPIPAPDFKERDEPQQGPSFPDQQRAVFSPRSQETLTLSLRNPEFLQPGNNVIQLSVVTKDAAAFQQGPQPNQRNHSPLPYTLTWSYRSSKPANDPQAPLRLIAKLNNEQAREGDTVKLAATVENVSGKGQGMAVAVLGLPAGLALPEDLAQINSLKPGKISAWELRGRELVLYWRYLAPGAKSQVEIDLTCRLPGQYRGPASRVYVYYDSDRKYWVEPLNIGVGVNAVAK